MNKYTLFKLECTLCDPEGKCCIDGSPEDLRLIDEALDEIRAHLSTEKLAPKIQNVWVNLYAGGTAYHYLTQEEADERGGITRIGNKAHKIEVEE